MRTSLVDTPAALAQCLALRRAVFIEEQGVPEHLEIDDADALCAHVLVIDDDGVAIGAARLKPLAAGVGKVQRVCVAKRARGRGVGRVVMDAIEQEARRAGLSTLVLGSQVSAIPFYERLGYVARGPVYEDAGIPHRDMDKGLAR